MRDVHDISKILLSHVSPLASVLRAVHDPQVAPDRKGPCAYSVCAQVRSTAAPSACTALAAWPGQLQKCLQGSLQAVAGRTGSLFLAHGSGREVGPV